MRTLLAVVLVACGACVGDARRAESTVREYNEAIILAYRTGDLSRLNQVAGGEEVRKVRSLLEIKRAAGLVLESNLFSCELLSAEVSGPEGLTVETKERWRYFDRALTPGQSPGPRFLAAMHMRYELERAGDGWRVRMVRTISNQILEPAGQRLAHTTHGEERREP